MSLEPRPEFYIEKLQRDRDLSAFDCGTLLSTPG
jgi:hypothetical protein